MKPIGENAQDADTDELMMMWSTVGYLESAASLLLHQLLTIALVA